MSGIFNSDDDKEERGGASSGDENDEILAELKKKQAELRALSHQNAIMLRHLHKQAKQELHGQELKKKMAAADAEVNAVSIWDQTSVVVPVSWSRGAFRPLPCDLHHVLVLGDVGLPVKIIMILIHSFCHV